MEGKQFLIYTLQEENSWLVVFQFYWRCLSKLGSKLRLTKIITRLVSTSVSTTCFLKKWTPSENAIIQ